MIRMQGKHHVHWLQLLFIFDPVEELFGPNIKGSLVVLAKRKVVD